MIVSEKSQGYLVFGLGGLTPRPPPVSNMTDRVMRNVERYSSYPVAWHGGMNLIVLFNCIFLFMYDVLKECTITFITFFSMACFEQI